jgi:hypothetical protein
MVSKTRKNRKGGASRCESFNDWYHVCYDDITEQHYVYFFNNRDERWYYDFTTEEFINDKDNSVCYLYEKSAVIYNPTDYDEPELIFKFAYNKNNGNNKLYFDKNKFIIKDGEIKLMKNAKYYEYNDDFIELYDIEAKSYYWYINSEGVATFVNPYDNPEYYTEHYVEKNSSKKKTKPKNFLNTTIRRKTKGSNETLSSRHSNIFKTNDRKPSARSRSRSSSRSSLSRSSSLSSSLSSSR